jgi:CAAX protease family protein
VNVIADSLRAHALMFERPVAPKYGDAAGGRILVAFIIVAIGVFFALRYLMGLAGARASPLANLMFVALLLAAFVAAQRFFVRVPMAEIGLRRFSNWTRRERLYFFQMIPLAAVVFAFVFRDHLRALLELHGVVGFVLFSVVTGLIWGFVQEFFYRGWLQTELTRRFGAIAGILVANTVFTFGPLHLNYLAGLGGIQWGGLAAVFGIGLFFGLVYHRSGNLWIPAVMHGLWPPNMS